MAIRYRVEVEETMTYEYYIESDEEHKLIDSQKELDEQLPIEVIDRQWTWTKVEENNNDI